MKFITSLLLTLTVLSHVAIAQYQQWGKLKPGPYSIGYRTLTITDSSRFYQDHFDAFESQASKQYRKIPLYIWYPAKVDSSNHYMTYGGYFSDLNNEQPYSKDGMYEILESLTRTFNISNAALLDAAKVPIPVVRNADPILQKFPVVLHTNANGLLMQSIQMEYLASQGYVVISYPRLGVDPLHYNWNDNSMEEEIVSVEDVGFVISKLAKVVRYADLENISFIGNLAEIGVMHQFKNRDLKAIVCEGCFFADGVKQMPFYDKRKFRIPVLQIRGPVETSLPFFVDSLIYAPAWSIKFKHLDHTDHYALPKAVAQSNSTELVNYEYLTLLIHEFLDAIQKNNASTLDFSSVPRDVLSFTKARPANKLAPTETEILSWIKNGEIEKAQKYLRDFKGKLTVNGELLRELITVISSNSEKRDLTLEAVQLYLTLYPTDPKQSFEYIFRKAADEELAVDIFSILQKKFPLSPYTYLGIAYFYDAQGNLEKSKNYSARAKELLSVLKNMHPMEKKRLSFKLNNRLKV